MRRSQGRRANGTRETGRRPLRVAGIKPTAASAKKTSVAAKVRSFLRKPLTWILAVVASILTGVLTGLPGQVVDVPAAQDQVRAATRDDLDIRIVSEVVHLEDQGYSMAMPRRYEPTAGQQKLMSDIFGADNGRDLARQLRSAGGADLDNLSMRVLFEGRRNQVIRIVDIRPVNIKRETSFPGTLFYLPPQAGPPNMQIFFDMDEKQPKARELVVDKTTDKYVGGELFFRKTSIPLPDRGQDVAIIRATAAKQAVSFDLQIEYVIGAERKETVFNNNGQPFRVTPPHCDPVTRQASYESAYEMRANANNDIAALPARDPRQVFECGKPH
jgi:hypothetical protein